jgi:hypothetical protein
MDAIGPSQETLHAIKVKRLLGFSYHDQGNALYLRIVLS